MSTGTKAPAIASVVSAVGGAVTKIVGAIFNRKAVKEREARYRQQLARSVVQEVEQAQLREAQRALQFAQSFGVISSAAESAGLSGTSVDFLQASADLSREIDAAQDQLALQGVFAGFAQGLIESASNLKQSKQQLGIDIFSAAFQLSADTSQTIVTARSNPRK